MVDVHMGQHQRADVLHGEGDVETICGGPPIGGGLRALEQPAVDQNAVVTLDEKLMARAGDTVTCAVMEDGWVHDEIL